jgi:hypothetical protein
MKLKRVTIPTAFLLLAIAMQASCVDRTEVSLSSEVKQTSKPLITNHLDYSQPYLIKDWLTVDPLNNDELLNPISSDPAASESAEKIQANAEYLQLITNHMLFGADLPDSSTTDTWAIPTASTAVTVTPTQTATAPLTSLTGNVYTDTPWSVPTSFKPTPLLQPSMKTSFTNSTVATNSSEVRSTTPNYVSKAAAPAVKAPGAPRLTEEQLRQQRAAANRDYVTRANARLDQQRAARLAQTQREARAQRAQAAPEASNASAVEVVTTTFGSAFDSLVRRETTKTRCATVRQKNGRSRRVCRSGNVSKSKCKEAVNDILTKHGMLRQRIPGTQAIDAHYWLSNPKHGFRNVKNEVGSSRRAPIGSILVYEDITPWKKKSERHGHIEIRVKANQYCSDHCTERPIDSSNWLRRLVGIYVPVKARVRR